MKAIHIVGSILAAGLLLTGCDNSASTGSTPTAPNAPSAKIPTPTPPPSAPTAEPMMYTVTLQNLTYAQPMAPMAVALHSEETSMFSVGSAASPGLEKLAEGGDNSMLIDALSANDLVAAVKGGNGLILPSKSDTVTITGAASKCLSITAMLVNSNDAFTGMNCIDISSLNNGAMLKIDLVSYDAGTENNSEEASTIPGPAGGGEGFNAERDDKDFVTVHPGVVTKDDGLLSSALTYAHKWDNPTAKLIIERVK